MLMLFRSLRPPQPTATKPNVWNFEHLDPSQRPLVTFKFRYRSRRKLSPGRYKFDLLTRLQRRSSHFSLFRAALARFLWRTVTSTP